MARRTGVRASIGEYILFLDGDDYLDVNACKDLYRGITKEKVDIFQFGTNIVPMGKYNEAEYRGLEKWLTPYNKKMTFEQNGDLTNLCYVEKSFGWSMWNKIYNGDIVRKAFSYVGDYYINMAEDTYLFFLISFFAKSYASTNKKYHYYNWGAGMTGGKQITQEFFAKKAERGKIVKYLSEFAEELDPSMNTTKAIDVINELFSADAVYDLVKNSELLDTENALEISFLSFDKADILSRLTHYYYSGDYLTKKHIIKLCQNIYSKNPTEKPIKTVGMFYFRMENGGIERVISQLIPIYLELGYRVILFTDEEPSDKDYEYPDTVKRIILPKIKNQNKEDYKKRFVCFQQAIKKYNVDAFVYHAWIAPYLLLDLLAIKSAGASFIIHTHSFFAFGYRHINSGGAVENILLNSLYKMCDAIVALTDVDYNWWATRFDHVYKTVNPFSLDVKTVIPSQLKSTDIIWVGRISPEKKPIEALRIIKNVIDSGCSAKLHIIGGADYEAYWNEVNSQIRKMGLEEHVVMHGYQNDVSWFFENASIYLHTSAYEGCSVSIAESKAYGLPAVIYKLPNLDIPLKKGMRIVEQDNAKAAAEHIVYLLQNSEEKISLGREARESFETMYSFDIAGLWKTIFTNLETNTKPELVKDSERLSVAIEMMHDFTVAGIESRHLWKGIRKYKSLANLKPVLKRIANHKWGEWLIKIGFKLKLDKLFR